MLFAFISRLESHPWGGCDELWSQAAKRLRGLGHDVVASVRGREGTKHPKVRELEESGILVLHRYPSRPLPLWRRCLRKVPGNPLQIREPDWAEAIARRKPDFLLISDGMNQAPKDLCRAFVNQGVPFAITMQCASEAYWPTDEEVERAGYVYEHAKAIYFVSEANRLLTKKQFVKEPLHAEVVRNPFNVGYDTPFAWPAPSDVWKLAFVGRLEPQSKGCDILLDIMDSPKWRSRNVLISFYGEGYNARSLRSYAQLLKLTNVRFCGHVDNIEKVWMEHHMLLLPARHEGVPMVVVEAMLCGRACITTNVGACGEFIHDNVTGFLSEAATVTHFDQAMERAWSVREHWREIGERAGAAIRAAVPPDPVGIFAQKLIELASSTAGPVDLPP